MTKLEVGKFYWYAMTSENVIYLDVVYGEHKFWCCTTKSVISLSSHSLCLIQEWQEPEQEVSLQQQLDELKEEISELQEAIKEQLADCPKLAAFDAITLEHWDIKERIERLEANLQK